MPVGELVGHLEQYAAASAAPLVLGDEVDRVTLHRDRYRVETAGRSWQARHVVVATGATGRPNVPAAMDRLDPDIELVTSSQYRNPDQLAPGGVLVVGASASGTQIADELVRAGRASCSPSAATPGCRGATAGWTSSGGSSRPAGWPATSARGEARNEPSLQLVGREPADPRGSDVDLAALQRAGVELAGHLGPRGRPPGRLPCRPARHHAHRRRADVPLPRHRRPLRRHPPPGRRGGAAGPAAAGRHGSAAHATRPARRGDRHGPAGHRLPTPPPLAADPGRGLRRRDPAGARGHRGSRPLRRRPAVPAPTRLDLHRRRPVRRPGRGVPPAAAGSSPSTRWRRRHEDLRRRRGGRPGRRRLDGPAARPGRRPGRAAGAVAGTARTRCPRTG